MKEWFERSPRGMGWVRLIPLILVFGLVRGSLAGAQVPIPLPGLSGTAKPAPATKGKGDRPAAAPTRDNPEATVATPPGPIDVEKPVDDAGVQQTLTELLPQLPGVRSAAVKVKEGVVTLEGHVEDNAVRDDVTAFTRRVEGVRLVLNRMKTDAQVLTGRELARNVLVGFWGQVSRNWLLVLIALGVVVIGVALARAFAANAEALLSPFIQNVMLRAVAGSLISSFLVIGGLLLALSVLHLTNAVLSILGVASIIGLAIGFAFRDITENFIASVLLGVRRPFRIGDYIAVAGHAGVVKTLNTRATVLLTLEGNHVRIPNNVIYKEILVNSSASASVRGKFDVLIPYEVSTAAALEAATHALRSQEGILADPPARALVEALEPSGIRMRAYFWMPGQGVDGDQLVSDARLRVKVALQAAGIAPPPSSVMVSVAGRVPIEVSEVEAHARPEPVLRPCAVVTAEQAKANLRHDSRAAANGTGLPTNGRHSSIEHAVNQAESHVSDEGANLLGGGKPRDGG